ncbi:hypothetical protein DRN62_02100 [Nanoarchaeota archaeon]|nr:MAG: hypothetical protein DRN62_02100 [Nanoarchaeota archaeon]
MVWEVQNNDVMIKKLKEVVIDHRSRAWCRLPYPGHPKGCPNYGKDETCPPKAPLLEEIAEPPFVLVAVKFDLEEHVKRMKERHPNWSDRKARCLLYWQKKVDKRLREICEKVASDMPNALILYKPEAHGVHVFETCRRAGLTLERNPKKVVWKVAIIGTKRNSSYQPK